MEQRLAAVVQCQQCKAQLQIVPSPSLSTSTEPPQPSGLSSRLEESFFILEGALAGRNPLPGGTAIESLDESFVVLQQGGGTGHYPFSSHRQQQQQQLQLQQQQQRFSLDARMIALAKVLELASEETNFDQPLCVDCAGEVRIEMEAQIEELESELAAYAALETKLLLEEEEGNAAPLDDRTFARELRRAKDELADEQQKLQKAEKELAAAEQRLSAAQTASHRLNNVETSYWHAYNAVMLFLRSAADHRDSLQQRVDATEHTIQTLRRTNVLSNVFRIWFDGPYGTISGVRLGSTREHPVEWWEINAAWGQAVLLLDTLARSINVRFKKIKLEPRGSYPRIHFLDTRSSADLCGPTSKIVCISYDRAQVGFLSCLKEFGQVLAARGVVEENLPFALKYPIEGDRVGGQSIRYGLSRDRAWTKALKYMLVNLKYCLKATLMMDSRSGGEGLVAALPREGHLGGGGS